MEPCGTPESTGMSDDDAPPQITCTKLVKYLFIEVIMLGSMLAK